MISCLSDIAAVSALIGGLCVGGGAVVITGLYWMMTRGQ